MIRAVIDTNIVLDALASREPFRAVAEQIFLMAAQEKFSGFITASSITDIYYLLRKKSSDLAAREAIRKLLTIFSIISVSGQDCQAALNSSIADYEDALVATCATREKLDYIVTRDAAFLKNCQLTISPEKFIKTCMIYTK